jgi:hypothetical protein
MMRGLSCEAQEVMARIDNRLLHGEPLACRDARLRANSRPPAAATAGLGRSSSNSSAGAPSESTPNPAHVLRIYRRHYNEHRPHRALRLQPPDGRDPTPLNATDRLHRHDLLGGLIHEYEAA